jgi:hypothetical protein
LDFSRYQHYRDNELLGLFIKYFNCGRLYTSGEITKFIFSSFQDIKDIIIPFFKKYPLQSAKALDFADFCKVAELIEIKAHLTLEGLDKIKKIKNGMNKGR